MVKRPTSRLYLTFSIKWIKLNIEITQFFVVNKTNYINTKAIQTIVIDWALGDKGPLEELTSLAKALSAEFSIMGISTEQHDWTYIPELGNVPEKVLRLLQDQVLNHQVERINLNIGVLFVDGSQISKTLLAFIPQCKDTWDEKVIPMKKKIPCLAL